MEASQPYETPLEASEYFSEHRRRGLLRLGMIAMFETQMSLVDQGKQTREQALQTITSLATKIALAQSEITS